MPNVSQYKKLWSLDLQPRAPQVRLFSATQLTHTGGVEGRHRCRTEDRWF